MTAARLSLSHTQTHRAAAAELTAKLSPGARLTCPAIMASAFAFAEKKNRWEVSTV